MRTIMDYLATQFASFDEEPFCAVDALVLSEFCMVRMERVLPPMRPTETRIGRVAARLRAHAGARRGVRFKDALMAEHYADMFTGLVPGKVKELAYALAASPRFRDMELRACASVFDEQACTQFAALSFSHRNDFAFVGFRGTDTSFTGWREDFAMAYSDRVPAQESAVRYLDAAAPLLPKRIYVGGHSKGGNLALCAAARCAPKTRARIARVFAFDAPGFRPGGLSDAQRAALREAAVHYVPRESFVGMLMDNPAPRIAVRSSASGMWQHDPFSWGVAGFDFQRCDGVAPSSLFARDVANAWLARYDEAKTRAIVDALFEAMKASGARDFADILTFGPQSAALLRDAAKRTDGAAKELLMEAAGDLAETIARRAWRGKEGPGGR